MSKTLSSVAQAISDDLQVALTFDKANTSVELDSTIYMKHAETAGLTEDGITAVKNHDRAYTAGLMHATGVRAMAAVIADPTLIETKLEATSATCVKGENFSATYVGRRSGTMKGQNGAPDTDWTSYGAVRAGHKSIISGRSNDLGAAMETVATASEEALKALAS